MAMIDTPLNKPQAPINKTVCGGILKDTAGYPSSMYEGTQVYFCTRACLRVFEENPSAFMEGEIEHPLDDE